MRAPGIEPGRTAWKAIVLPLNHARMVCTNRSKKMLSEQFLDSDHILLFIPRAKVVSAIIHCMKDGRISTWVSASLALTICFLVSSPTYADSRVELQAQIDSLLRQIAVLQNRNQIIIPSDFQFTRDLKRGSTGTDVRYLQILLNRDPETKVTASGEETTYFGVRTKAGVIAFQHKYATDIFSPTQRNGATGTVGILTRAKLNALLQKLQTPPTSPAVSLLPQTASTPIIPVASSSAGSFATSTPEEPVFSFNELNAKTRDALVNILCTTKRGGFFDPLSGSGIIIDPRGVILTNAHIGQYFLLKDFRVQNFIECVIRTGAPAQARYRAKLLYLSPQWIERNFKNIVKEEPEGTGKHDFSFLLITESIHPDSFPLPKSFSYLPLEPSSIALAKATSVLIAAYPAGFLSGISIQKDLFPTSSVVEKGQIYSFKDTQIFPDIFSIGASPVAQHGSSGGAVVSRSGKVLGILATAFIGTTTASSELHAVSINHIARSFTEHTGDDLSKLFEGDLFVTAESFNKEIAPALRKLLEDAINKTE